MANLARLGYVDEPLGSTYDDPTVGWTILASIVPSGVLSVIDVGATVRFPQTLRFNVELGLRDAVTGFLANRAILKASVLNSTQLTIYSRSDNGTHAIGESLKQVWTTDDALNNPGPLTSTGSIPYLAATGAMAELIAGADRTFLVYATGVPVARAIQAADLPDLSGTYQVAGSYVPATRTVNGHALSSNVTVTPSDLSLGNVENTALSTWSGSTNLVTLGAASATRLDIIPTDGTGYVALAAQVSDPSAPSAGQRLFGKSSGLSWIGVNGFTRTFNAGSISASRIWTLPDANDTLVGKATTDTFTNKSGNISQWTNDASYTTLAAVAGVGYLTTVTAHNLLSATHADTLISSVSRGAIIYGNATPAWALLAKPSVLSGLSHDGTDVSWVTATGTGAPVRSTNAVLVTPTVGVASGTSLALGSNTATTGALMLANTGSINARNAANSANVTLLSLDASNVAQVGGGSDVYIRAANGVGIRLITSTISASYSQIASDVAKFWLGSNSSSLLLGNGDGSGSSGVLITSGTIRLIAPAAYSWNSSTSDAEGSGGDLFLLRDAANTLAQRNSTTAQKTRFYNTFTTVDTAGEWFEIDWRSVSNRCILTTRKGSSSGTLQGMTVGASSTVPLSVYGVTPIVQPVLATGAAHTVDDVITALQNFGIVRQS